MPSVKLYPVYDTFVSTRRPKENYCYEDHLYVGRRRSRKYRSVLRFNLGLIPEEATIISAALHFYIYANSYPEQVKNYEVHRITCGYNDEKVSWKKQPPFDPVIANSFSVENEVNTTVSVDLSTLTCEWKLGSYENFGLLVKAQNESEKNRIGLRSVNCSYEQLRPFLQVDYQQAGPEASVIVDGYIFSSSVGNGETEDYYHFTIGQDVSTVKLYNYFISNTGSQPATVILQISPNNSIWHTDIPETVIEPFGTAALTWTHLGKYVRMGYKSANPGNSTTLAYWFQCQS